MSGTSSAEAPSGTEDPGEPARRVLAFYYGWHSGGKDGRHWSMGITGEPEAGYYDNHDPEDTRHQFRLMRDAGVHGIVLSWWGRSSFEEESLRVALEVGAEEDIAVTASFETWAEHLRYADPEERVKELEHLWRTHAHKDAWLTVDGKPVIFVHAAGLRDALHWADVFLALEAKGIDFHAYAEVRDAEQATAMAPLFEGLYYYMPVELARDGTLDDSTKEMTDIAADAGGEWLPTVVRGYDNTNDSIKRFHLVVDHEDGRLLEESWEIAAELDSRFILIGTWNEWNEGTTFEPGVHDGGRWYRDLIRLTSTLHEPEAQRASPRRRSRRGSAPILRVQERGRAPPCPRSA